MDTCNTHSFTMYGILGNFLQKKVPKKCKLSASNDYYEILSKVLTLKLHASQTASRRGIMVKTWIKLYTCYKDTSNQVIFDDLTIPETNQVKVSKLDVL